jgi:hypothetical protein
MKKFEIDPEKIIKTKPKMVKEGIGGSLLIVAVIIIIALLFGMSLTSCKTQRNSQSNNVTHVLSINEKGDTVQVPIRELRREFRNEYQPNQYNDWQFYWGNNWYWGNVWYPYYFIPYQYGYRYYYWDNWYWRRNPVIINQPGRVQPSRQVAPPRTNPRRATPTEPRRYIPPTPPRQITPQQQRTNPPRVTPTQPRVTPQQQRTNPPRVTPTQPRVTPNQQRTPSRGVNPPKGNPNVIRQRPTN